MLRIYWAAMALLLIGAAPAPSMWNGTWRFAPERSSPGTSGSAAAAYRFKVEEDGSLRWEIPSRREVLNGRLDGRPMPIAYPGAPPGLTLAVTGVSAGEWTYQVAKDGQVMGGGRMVLIDGASAWVDLTWGRDGPGHGHMLVYVRS